MGRKHRAKQRLTRCFGVDRTERNMKNNPLQTRSNSTTTVVDPVSANFLLSSFLQDAAFWIQIPHAGWATASSAGARVFNKPSFALPDTVVMRLQSQTNPDAFGQPKQTSLPESRWAYDSRSPTNLPYTRTSLETCSSPHLHKRIALLSRCGTPLAPPFHKSETFVREGG